VTELRIPTEIRRELLGRMWTARNQAESFLHRGTDEGLRYEGEARAYSDVLRMLNSANYERRIAVATEGVSR
jgi:hypothetical protein